MPSSPASNSSQDLRDRLARGRYMLSEHVVRSLMSGEITVPEIEAVLRAGRIIEEHRPPGRATGYLFCGIVKGKPLHVVGADGGDDWLVVSFAYVPKPPLWLNPLVRAPEEVAPMSKSFARCYFCGGDIKSVTVGNFDYRLEGKLYVIKRVPAGLCLQCGEKYVDTEVSRRLNSLIEGRQFTQAEEVQVIEYQ
jgi:YgiT-type zinc finger domain-containing protein